ncbi:MAG: toll/interleukin-1 receptor domain-containing protein [Anaerolineales bacterium]|nr:toll/interleukin-1 receptor domain-containing protein [Anaerolineales bacterium]
MEVVEKIERWLVDRAGISILHTIHPFHTGDSIDDALENALELCQSAIVLVTKSGIESGQVRREFELGLRQQALTENLFRIIPIRLEQCVLPDFLRSIPCIDLTENGFDLATASKLLIGLFPNGLVSEERQGHDIFVSHPWSYEENGIASQVFKIAKRLGFRLISNPFEQRSHPVSLKKLVSGCGGGMAIIPKGIGDKVVNKIFLEIEIQGEVGLPFIIVAESSVKIPEKIANNALSILRFDEISAGLEKQIHAVALKLQEEWITPPEYQYIFYGTDLKDEHKARNSLLQKSIQHISAMPCLMGEDIQHAQVQNGIIRMIVHAQMMIADISRENLNTCIEAGVAIGSDVPLNLLSGDDRHKPPFMFRDRQVWHYADDLDLLGIIYKLVVPYRRYIL